MELALPPEILYATARIYSGILVALDCPPPLSNEEEGAIVAALDAVARKYGGDVKHAELVVLALAIGAPLLTRLPERARRKHERERLAHTARIVREVEKEQREEDHRRVNMSEGSPSVFNQA